MNGRVMHTRTRAHTHTRARAHTHTHTRTHTHAHNGILLSHKKREILSFAATWMDLEGIFLSEISQTKKDKYYMISLICEI